MYVYFKIIKICNRRLSLPNIVKHSTQFSTYHLWIILTDYVCLCYCDFPTFQTNKKGIPFHIFFHNVELEHNSKKKYHKPDNILTLVLSFPLNIFPRIFMQRTPHILLRIVEFLTRRYENPQSTALQSIIYALQFLRNPSKVVS